MEMLSLQVKLR